MQILDLHLYVFNVKITCFTEHLSFSIKLLKNKCIAGISLLLYLECIKDILKFIDFSSFLFLGIVWNNSTLFKTIVIYCLQHLCFTLYEILKSIYSLLKMIGKWMYSNKKNYAILYFSKQNMITTFPTLVKLHKQRIFHTRHILASVWVSNIWVFF